MPNLPRLCVAAMQMLGFRLFWLLSAVNTGALASPFNQSVHLVLPNTNSGYEFICDGLRYGTFHDEEVSACVDAKEAIAAGRERIRFAMRDTPEATREAYPLPWRWMDSWSSIPGPFMSRLMITSETASCYVQIRLKPGTRSGSNSLYKLHEAASELIRHCVLRQGQGGTVYNTGM